MKRIFIVIIAVMALCAAFSQQPRKAPAAPKKPDLSLRPKSFTRPKPTKPVKPYVPSIPRNQPDKFFLEHADLLYSDHDIDSTRQVVSGNVLFTKMGTKLYCDSAWYYPASASLDAFGNVRMLQGDTITVLSDFIYYDGFTQQARLRTAGRGKEVSLEHTSKHDATKKWLFTDSLDYDLRLQLASYNDGGRMYNQNMRSGERDTLTSRRGQYDATTRVAEVSENVFIHNRTSRLNTERLLYHTEDRVVELVEPTHILSGAEEIDARTGTYNMGTGNALLSSRSLITHRDTAGNAITMEGDSVVYTAATRLSEAYMYADPLRHPRPMVITDTARKSILIGGYGFYNDSTKVAQAERYPLLKEYSRPDTIFLRADKIFTQTMNSGAKPLKPVLLDSLSTAADTIEAARVDSINANTEYHLAKAWPRARFFRRDLQGVADSITFNSRDSLLYLDRKPIVWSEGRMVAGESIIVHFNDSTADRAHLPRRGVVAEEVGEGFYNQLSAGRMTAFLKGETMDHLDADTDVQAILLPMENDSTYNKLVNAMGDTLSLELDGKEVRKLKLYTRPGNEVSGTVIPLHIIQKSQYYLPAFISLAGAERFSEMDDALKILEAIRPRYAWYRDGWQDSLGELDFDLEEYFTNPKMGLSPSQPGTLSREP